jgi:hypothetical protein
MARFETNGIETANASGSTTETGIEAMIGTGSMTVMRDSDGI